MDIIRIILAVLLPPLGVFLQVGIGLQFWLNILLTLLGYIPASFTPSGSSRAADHVAVLSTIEGVTRELNPARSVVIGV